MPRPHVSIIIPTLNEEENIAEMLSGVRKIMSKLSSSYELIVVDGGRKGPSADRTVEIAKRHGAKVLYDFKGKGSALITGFAAALGDVIVSMDADLSHKPEELRLLIAGIDAGYDVCLGSRFLVGGGSADMPRYRVFGNWVLLKMVNILYGSKYTDLCYGYRSFSRHGLKGLGKLRELEYGIETEINIKAQKAHLRVLEVPSYEKKRGGGTAKVPSVGTGLMAIRTILKNLG